MKWPQDSYHTTRFEHQFGTGLVKGTEHFSFVSALLRGGERGKNKKGFT